MLSLKERFEELLKGLSEYMRIHDVDVMPIGFKTIDIEEFNAMVEKFGVEYEYINDLDVHRYCVPFVSEIRESKSLDTLQVIILGNILGDYEGDIEKKLTEKEIKLMIRYFEMTWVVDVDELLAE